MLILASTSDKIQVITGQAVTVDVHATYMDYDGSTVTPGRKNTAITTNTTTDVVTSPGSSSIFRNVRSLEIRNKHASTSVDVTVQHTDGSTVVELVKDTLLAGETLQYVDGVGFVIYAAANPPYQFTYCTTDRTTTGQSLVDIADLSLPLLANRRYKFAANMTCTTTAVTTGIKYGVQFSAAGASVEAGIVGSSNATTATTMERISALNTATTNAFLLGSAQTGAVAIRGQLIVGANAGNLTIQHFKVTSGTSTVKQYSFLEAWLVG